MVNVALEIVNIVKCYSAGVPVVDRVNLQVHEGEMVVLVGPSGCGKTTLLRLIAGLEEVSAGRLVLHHLDITNDPPGKRDIAMVFQNYALYPFKTVYENLAFGLRMRRIPKGDIDRLVRNTASRLGLGSLLDRYPNELSGGQQQRVALGRAIVRKPRLFLFDEPLSSLDPNLRRGMRQEIKRLQRESGTAAIYVTHDQEEAMSLGDRVVVMRHGSLVQVATPKEIYLNPATRFVAEFFGTPPMNILTANVLVGSSGVTLSIAPDEFVHEIPAHLESRLAQINDKFILIGFRPESLRMLSGALAGLTMRLKVTVLEDFGEHIDASFVTVGGRTVIGRLSADCVLQEGDWCEAQVAFEECFWFRNGDEEKRFV